MKKPRIAAAVMAVTTAVELDDDAFGAAGDDAAAYVEEQPQVLGYVQGRNLRCTWA